MVTFTVLLRCPMDIQRSDAMLDFPTPEVQGKREYCHEMMTVITMITMMSVITMMSMITMMIMITMMSLIP